MRILIATLIIYAVLMQAPTSVRKEQQAPTQHRNDVAKQLPAASEKSSVTIVDNPAPTEKQNGPKEQSKWWVPPPPWDIYWPTIGLVIATGLAVCAALKTLKAINAQVKEMKKALIVQMALGAETEKLVKQATEQSVAATRSVDALINSERAWIVTECRRFKAFPWYVLSVTNMGRTPAQVIGFQLMYTCLPEGITELPENSGGEFAHFKELNHLLAAGSGMEIGNPFDVRKLMSDSWQEINDLKKTAVFHGWVTYKHVFSAMEDCKSEFCYVYTPSAQRLSSVGRHTRYK